MAFELPPIGDILGQANECSGSSNKPTKQEMKEFKQLIENDKKLRQELYKLRHDADGMKGAILRHIGKVPDSYIRTYAEIVSNIHPDSNPANNSDKDDDTYDFSML